MQKVHKAMKSIQKYALEKLIHVDEFTTRGKEKGRYRSRINRWQ
jgi:hypothetical protein